MVVGIISVCECSSSSKALNWIVSKARRLPPIPFHSGRNPMKRQPPLLRRNNDKCDYRRGDNAAAVSRLGGGGGAPKATSIILRAPRVGFGRSPPGRSGPSHVSRTVCATI